MGVRCGDVIVSPGAKATRVVCGRTIGLMNRRASYTLEDPSGRNPDLHLTDRELLRLVWDKKWRFTIFNGDDIGVSA
jgi:hypothetical protein